MSDKTYRDRWKALVYRTPRITDAVRVALLALSEEMNDDGMVEIGRDDLSVMLGRSPQRIGDRVKAGIDSGLLRRVSRGQRNGKGRYQATDPAQRSSAHPGGSKNSDVFSPPGGVEEDSLQPVSQAEETDGLQPTRGGRRGQFDPSVFSPPGGVEEAAPIYKARAGAHSNGDPSTPNGSETAHSGRLVVARLVEEIEPSLRSEKTLARKRAGEPADDPDFAQFWAAYPRRVAKPAALKAWAKAIKNGADPEQIILAARQYATNPRRRESDIKYTAHPATWLNQERWADEPDDEQQPMPVLRRPASRQEETDAMFERALQRARARDAMEAGQ